MNPLELFKYDPLAGALTWASGQPAGTMNHGYRVSIRGVRHLATAIIWEIMTGAPPTHRVLHIDGDFHNLRWANLTAWFLELTQPTLQALMVYDPDDGALRWRSGRRVGTFSRSTGLEYVTISGTRHEVCAIVWLYVYGELPTTALTFNDGDSLNYSIMNLSLMPGVSRRRRRKTSKHHGIYWLPKEDHWMVRHTYDEVVYPLGVYTDIEKARLARSEFNAHAGKCIAKFQANPEEWQAAFNANPADWLDVYLDALVTRLGEEGQLDYYVAG